MMALLMIGQKGIAQKVYEHDVKDTAAVQREVYAQIRVRPRF